MLLSFHAEWMLIRFMNIEQDYKTASAVANRGYAVCYSKQLSLNGMIIEIDFKEQKILVFNFCNFAYGLYYIMNFKLDTDA